MAQNTPSFRFPFASLAKLPPEAQAAHLATFNALTDIYQAFSLQKSNSSSATTTLNETVLAASGTGGAAGVKSFNSETGDVTFFQDLFFVNNQTGQTAYTTKTSDAGALIVLNDASPIAVGLNFTVPTNWATWIANYGSGTATLTPTMVPSGATSTISYPNNLAVSSMPLPSGFAAFLFFDGVNFWAIAIPIVGGGGTITGVTAGTGLTGGGTSGVVTIALSVPVSVVNGGTGTNTPSLVNGTGISITGTWPNQTVTATTGYSLGGTLSSGNLVLGPGAGTGATGSVTGLDGNHQVVITTGTAPTGDAVIYTLTFTTSRGHVTYPVISVNLADEPDISSIVFSSSATSYEVSSADSGLVIGGLYTWNVSCP